MIATDIENEAIRAPVISRETTFSCLDRVCGTNGVRRKITAIESMDDIESALPLDRLIAIAEKSGFQLRAVNLDWRELLIATSTKKILLLLRNANTVAVLGTGREGVEEVTVSDPLYQWRTFFLPRVALEHA